MEVKVSLKDVVGISTTKSLRGCSGFDWVVIVFAACRDSTNLLNQMCKNIDAANDDVYAPALAQAA